MKIWKLMCIAVTEALLAKLNAVGANERVVAYYCGSHGTGKLSAVLAYGAKVPKNRRHE